MRIVIGLLLLLGALVLLAGPAFGVAAVASGNEVDVSGGSGRVLFDLVVGGLLLRAAVNRLCARPIALP